MNRFSEMMSDVEIVGDPANMVTEADKSITEYVAKGFKLSDRIWIGIGNGVALAAGLTGNVQAQVNNPFKPYRVGFPSEYAVDTFLEQLSYGSLNMVDADPVPMDMFSEAANRGDVSIPTVQTAQPVLARVRNDGADQIQISLALYGIRLRQ